MSDLVFEPGQPIPNYETNPTNSEEVEVTSAELKEQKTHFLLQALLLLSVTIIFFILLISLIRMKDIKLILRLSLFLLILLLLAISINWIPSSPKSISLNNPSEAEITDPLFYFFSPSGEPSENIYRLIGIVILIIIVWLIIYILVYRKKKNQNNNSLADEAENAIKAIEEGRSIENVIIYCYMRMSEIIIENRGIERESYLTPREFETQLVTEGIPLFPVQQLTKLFEEIRYGKKILDHQAKLLALDSLREIRISFQQDNTRPK